MPVSFQGFFVKRSQRSFTMVFSNYYLAASSQSFNQGGFPGGFGGGFGGSASNGESKKSILKLRKEIKSNVHKRYWLSGVNNFKIT